MCTKIFLFHNRQDYHRWIIHSHYLITPIQDGGSQGSYRQLCAGMLEALLTHDLKSAVFLGKKSQRLCCHGDNKKCGDVMRINGGCRSEIIQLLQVGRHFCICVTGCGATCKKYNCTPSINHVTFINCSTKVSEQ